LHSVYLHTKINTAVLPAPLLYYINEALLLQNPRCLMHVMQLKMFNF